MSIVQAVLDKLAREEGYDDLKDMLKGYGTQGRKKPSVSMLRGVKLFFKMYKADGLKKSNCEDKNNYDFVIYSLVAACFFVVFAIVMIRGANFLQGRLLLIPLPLLAIPFCRAFKEMGK